MNICRTITFILQLETPMSSHKTVWSSERGDVRKAPPPPAKGYGIVPLRQKTVYLHRESSGRGGKAVTLIKNLTLSAEGLKSLTKRIKQECGAGGTVKDGTIEIQGEHRKQIAELLSSLGYQVKIAGG